MATITNQGAVRIQSSAENPAARSSSRYAMVPGNAPADIRRARCQAIIPSAISVFSNMINDKYVTLENEKHRQVRPHIAPLYGYYGGTRYLEAPCCNTGNGFVTVDPWIAIGNFARGEVRQD